MKFVQEGIPHRARASRNEMVNITEPGSARRSSDASGIVDKARWSSSAPTPRPRSRSMKTPTPPVPHDMLLDVRRTSCPNQRSGYRHAEGNSDAHCKSSLVGTSELILVHDGHLTLGHMARDLLLRIRRAAPSSRDRSSARGVVLPIRLCTRRASGHLILRVAPQATTTMFQVGGRPPHRRRHRRNPAPRHCHENRRTTRHR